MPGAEEFLYLKGKVGCVLSHGFTGAPFEVYELGTYLANKGISVIGPRLPGHGTTIQDMIPTTAKEWYAKYLQAYDTLREHCEEVFVGGLSLGGVLTLKCATERAVQGIISMAAPMNFDPFGKILLPFFAPIFKKATIKKSKKDLAYQKAQGIVSYSSNPIGPANSVRKLIRNTRKNLSHITAPILILQGLRDSKWIIKSAKVILEGVSSEVREIVYLEHSPHCFTVGPEKELIHKLVFDFIKNQSNLI